MKKTFTNSITQNQVPRFEYETLKKKLNEERWARHELETQNNVLQNKIQLLQKEIEVRNLALEEFEKKCSQ